MNKETEVVTENKETEVKKVFVRRGKLAGLEIGQMTDSQLRTEIVNAKSVLTKSKAKGSTAEKLEPMQARVDAAVAERDRRKAIADEAKVEAEVEAEVATQPAEDTAELL